jgi:hypothetical protein
VKSTLFFSFFSVVLSSFLFFPDEAYAQGNLLIMPRRVVFEGAKKSQELTLSNSGADSATYVVSFVQMRMKEDGSFEQITSPDSGQFFSNQYFRIFPRTVKLGPKESQLVKMQYVKSSKMAPGEYRSHLYFRSIPNDRPLGDAPLQDSTSLAVRLVPVFGITIPAIIRVGECSASVAIKDLILEKVNDTLTRIQMSFNRNGNASVYGDIAVFYTSPQGKVTRVAVAKGLAVYTPNSFRKFQCNLDRNSDIDYRIGKLKVVYSASEDLKSAKLAEKELILQW